jgi:hypothetical protein
VGEAAELLSSVHFHTMKYFAFTLIAIGILNFLSFCIIAMSIGGDAVDGRIDGGRYFVSAHGRDTEVSRSAFEYSRFHARSVWVTHPLAFCGFVLLFAEHEKRKARPSA